MAEPNPMTVIADCIEKSEATTDPELIGDYIAEALGLLQIDETEDDAFGMLGGAIVDAVADDPAHTVLFEVWSQLQKQRQRPSPSPERQSARNSSRNVISPSPRTMKSTPVRVLGVVLGRSDHSRRRRARRAAARADEIDDPFGRPALEGHETEPDDIGLVFGREPLDGRLLIKAWIAEHISGVDVCITSDMPSAFRCLDPRHFGHGENSSGKSILTFRVSGSSPGSHSRSDRWRAIP